MSLASFQEIIFYLSIFSSEKWQEVTSVVTFIL